MKQVLEKTIVIFTSDHGYHLGEHDFWAKVSLRDESSGVPLTSVPGKPAKVCNSLVELLDLYPTISSLCGLEIPAHNQGKDILHFWMTQPNRFGQLSALPHLERISAEGRALGIHSVW